MAAKTTDPIDILLEMGIDLDNLSEEEDYLSALKEAIATIEFKTGGKGDERSAALREEVIKVRKSRKAADTKFKAKKTTVKPENLFQRRLTPKQNTLPSVGAIVPYKASEEEEGAKKKRAPRKSDPLKDILKGVNSIIEILKRQQKFSAKQAEKDRKSAEKQKRAGAEDKLESGGVKSFISGAAKLVKPVKGFLDGLFDFIKNVLIGTVLIKIINWFTDPENQEKITAIGDFFKNTWPVLLAAYLLFGNSLGRFAVKLIKVVGGFVIKLASKIIPALITGIKRLGLGKSLALGGLAVGGAMLAGRMMDGGADDKDPPPDKKPEPDKAAPAPAPAPEQTEAPAPAGKTPYERATNAGYEVISANTGYILYENKKTGKTKTKSGTFVLQGDTKEERFNNFFDGSSDYRTLKLKGGGQVPGSGPNKDTVPAMLAPGEFVMSRGAVQKYGADTMASMNAAGGGTNLPKRMNGVTYAAGGGLMGDMSDYGYGDDKKEEPSPTVAKEMEKRKEKSSNPVGDFFGGVASGVRSLFGGGGDDKETPRKGADGEEKQQSGSTLSETQQKALQVLAKYESGAAGYDAVNQIGTKGGRGVEGFSGDIKKMPQHEGRSLTDFTIAEIKALQYDDKTMTNDQWIKAGKLHAVGAYQFIGNTLPGVASRAGIPDTAKFTPAVQDLMALQLMKERGISPWVGPSDKATASERAIVEQARLEPIAYDKTSGGGAITAFGGGGGTYTPPGPGGGGVSPSGTTMASLSDYKIGSGIATLTGGKTGVAGVSPSGTTLASLQGKKSFQSPPGPPPTSPPTIGGSMPGGSQQGSSANSASKMKSNANNFPEIDANAMISMEKVKVLGLTLA